MCDSKNINASPFCNLSNTLGPVKWASDVKRMYTNKTMPEYVESLLSSTRYNYATEERRNDELLEPLVQVGLKNDKVLFFFLFFLQIYSSYNAFERDIAVVNIFFGKTNAKGTKFSSS